MLFNFCLQSFLQNFAFMNFSTDSTLVENDALKLSGGLKEIEMGLIYYGAYAATLPAMIVSMVLLLRGYDRTAGLAMSLLIVIAGWLRYLAALQQSYALALTSTVILGLAGGVIFTSFTFLPERWFPPHERAFATALAAQSCYAGWALGCFNPPMLGREIDQGSGEQHTLSGLRSFLLAQAIITSSILPLQLATNTRGPLTSAEGDPSAHGGSHAAAGSGSLSVGRSLQLLAGRPQYLIHSSCYAVLGAVGYGVPGVAVDCFSDYLGDLSDFGYLLIGFFVISGVATGLLCGKLVPVPWYGAAVRVLFAVGSSALLTIQILLFASSKGADVSRSPWRLGQCLRAPVPTSRILSSRIRSSRILSSRIHSSRILTYRILTSHILSSRILSHTLTRPSRGHRS